MTPGLPRHLVLAAVTAGYLGWAVLGGPAYALGAGLAALAAGTAWAALLRRTLRSPRPQVPTVGAGGALVLRGSAVTAALLVAAWLLGIAGTLVCAVPLVTGSGAGPATRLAVFTMIALVVVGLPNLARLLTGRLRVWRLEAHPDRLDYVDARRTSSVPWSAVRWVEHDRRRAELVVRRADGELPLRIPYLLFDAPPEQLAALVERDR